MPYCAHCGKEISKEFIICPYCGKVPRPILNTSLVPPPPPPPQAFPPPPPPFPPPPPPPSQRITIETKNPGIGAVLSLLIAGLGQIYAGKIGRGLIIMLILVPLTAIVAVLFFWLILPLFFPLIFWIWNIYDAYNLCKEYNIILTQTGRPPW